MGKLEDLKEDEEEAIAELKTRLKNVLTSAQYEDDLLFYKFLKARDFDINKAELMLRKHITLRKAFRMDTITQDFQPKEAFIKYIQGTYLGIDKSGCIVRYIAIGRIYTQDVVNCFNFISYYTHWFWTMECDRVHLKEANIKCDKNKGKMTVIFDLDGIELSNLCYPYTLPFVSRVAEIYQDNYPENLKSAFVINAPSFVMFFVSIMKNVIDPEVFKKIHIFGRSGWKEELVKVIDADLLPAFLGGNKTDPDGNPMCNTFMNRAGRIPSKYYLSKQDKTLKDTPQVKAVTIQPRARHEVSVEVNECGSIIEWKIEVKNKDIGVGIYFKESEENTKELIPMHRYETWLGIHQDSYKCDRPGAYVILLDNSYSWFHSKKVLYCLRVIKPNESPS